MWMRSEYFLDRPSSGRVATVPWSIRLKDLVSRDLVRDRPDAFCAAVDAALRFADQPEVRTARVIGYFMDGGAFESPRMFLEGPDLDEKADGSIAPHVSISVTLATDAEHRRFREAIGAAVNSALSRPRRENVADEPQKRGVLVTIREGRPPARYNCVPESLLADALGSSNPIAFADLNLTPYFDGR